MLNAPSIYDNILRSYQKESFDQTFSLWNSYQSIMLAMPGGGGKTLTAAAIIQKLLNKGKRVWFLAHRRELIFNAQENLFDKGIQSGVIMGTVKPTPHLLCQVGSVQTVDRRLELTDPDYIIFDEGHRAVAESYKRIRARYPHAKILGLSGTPFSANPANTMGDVYDAQVSNILSSELMAMGCTVPCEHWCPDTIVSKSFKTKNTEDGPEFDMKKMSRAFDQEAIYASMIKGYKERADGLKTIVFCCSVEHSKKTAMKFNESGYRFAHIDGDMPKFLRDQLIREYKSGYLQGLTNYGILAEGFDVPETRCVILNLNTASMIKYFQACWRGARPFLNKLFYILLDMGDNYIRFGDPQQDIVCDLANNYVPKGSSGTKPQKKCKVCSKVVDLNVKICTHCQAEFIKTLEEVDEERMIQLNAIQKKEILLKNWKLDLLYKLPTEDIEHFARVRGWNKRNWHKLGYDKTWAKKELDRRAKGYKAFRLLDFDKPNLRQMEEWLANDYRLDKPIDAEMYQFVSETDDLITFRFKKKEKAV